jgi:hypothetical protein
MRAQIGLLLVVLAFALQLAGAVLIFAPVRFTVSAKIAWLFPLKGRWLQWFFALLLFLVALGVLKLSLALKV